jgi:sugar phosphate isomerase/epimerase
MRDGFSDLPEHVETVEVAGVEVPSVCCDRVTDVALAEIVDILDDYGVTHYRVSPVGGLQVGVSIHRHEETIERLKTELSAGHELTIHGVEDGFLRLRIALSEE